MSRWQLGISWVLAMLCMVAMGICLWSLLVLGRMDAALVGAVILLGLAQMVAYFSRLNTRNDTKVNVNDLMRANSAISREFESLGKRVERLEADKSGQIGLAIRQLAQQMKGLEHTVSALSRTRLAAPASSEPRQRPGPAQLEVVSEPAPQQAAPRIAAQSRRHPAEAVSDDQFDLFLEPIVRIAEGRTVYYRASLAYRQHDGSSVSADSLHEEAHREGYLADLVLMAFMRAAPVIRRLQARKRGIGVFCAVTSHSFADKEFLNRLLEFLEQNRDVAGSLVIEVSQSALAGLSARGMQGLAYLAGLGATFSLTGTRLESPDMATLAKLGFSFIDADIELLADGLSRQQGGLSMVLEAARKHQMTLIAANVKSEQDLARIGDQAQLARGTFFSPPRLVRQDVSEQRLQAAVA